MEANVRIRHGRLVREVRVHVVLVIVEEVVRLLVEDLVADQASAVADVRLLVEETVVALAHSVRPKPRFRSL